MIEVGADSEDVWETWKKYTKDLNNVDIKEWITVNMFGFDGARRFNYIGVLSCLKPKGDGNKLFRIDSGLRQAYVMSSGVFNM